MLESCELFGYDFVLDAHFNVWLLEVPAPLACLGVYRLITLYITPRFEGGAGCEGVDPAPRSNIAKQHLVQISRIDGPAESSS